MSMWADAWELELAASADLPSCLFANFYSSGHDRRGGLLNLTNSTGTVGAAQVYDRLSLYLVLGGRQQSITPYAWLVGIYGGGNNSFDE